MKRQLSIFACIVVGLFSIWSLAPIFAQTYVEPGGQPPSGAVISPLNSSTSTERKAGNLLIGPAGGSAVVCLNPDPANASLSPASNPDCLSSWASLTTPLGGPFVRVSGGSYIATDPFQVSSYTKQDGYVRIRATGNGQAISLLGKAGDVCLDINFDPCAWGSGPGICRCQNDGVGNGCRTNSDCVEQNTGRPSSAAGVYGSDGGNSLNVAAEFDGRLYVKAGLSSSTGQLCLNGTDNAACISSWDEISGASAVTYVKLQSTPPDENQTGSAMTSGVAHVGSLVAGNPGSLPLSMTCGDGICTSATENTANCSVDCGTINPPSFTGLQPSGSGVMFRASSTTLQAGGNTTIMVVRSTGTPPDFVPVAGATYSAGQTYGNSRIYFVGTFAPGTNLFNSIPADTPIGPGITYYYTMYQANQYPRCSTGVTQTFKGWTLTAQKYTYTSKAVVTAQNLLCGTTCSFVSVLEADGTLVSFETAVQGGYIATYSGACSGYGCDFTMDGSKNVYITISVNNGGSGGGGRTGL